VNIIILSHDRLIYVQLEIKGSYHWIYL